MIKSNLIKEGFQKTKIGQIPNDWKSEKLGEYVISSAFGPRFSSDLYSETGNIATLRTTDVSSDGRLNLKGMPLANLSEESLSNHILLKDDVVVSRSGTIGMTGIFPGYSLPVVPGAFLIRLRLNKTKLLPSFLLFYLTSANGRNRVVKLAGGGVQKNLQGTALRTLLVPIPELPEQKKIAQILTTWDTAIENLETLIQKKQELKKGLMQVLLTGKVRFDEFESKWKEQKLKDINVLKKPKSVNPYDFPKKVYAHYSIPAFSKIGKPVIEKGREIKSNKFLIERNQILFGKLNPRVWKLWFVEDDNEFTKISSTEFIPIKADDIKIETRFLYQFLLSNYVKFKVNQMISGSTGSHKRINPRDFFGIKINIPTNIEEQRKIANLLECYDKEIKKLTEELTHLQTQKKGLMQKLLTGEVRVKI